MADNYPFLNRLIAPNLKKLFKAFSGVVLLGARQVGKSTLLDHLYPDVERVVFDPIQDIRGARADPDLFLRNHKPPIILDEIQYVPQLIPSLKRFIDEAKVTSQYLLTGSQQWGVMKNVAESLAGRVVLLELHTFALCEVADKLPEQTWLERWLNDPDAFIQSKVQRLPTSISLVKQLWRGFLPEAQFLEQAFIPDFLSAYQQTYIERDVRLLIDVSNLQQFGQFVRLIAALSAQEVNYSQLGRDIGISPQTASRWLNALKQTFQWFELPAFSNNVVKKISIKPKGYLMDTGLLCFSQMISSPEALPAHPLWGAIFETAVIADIKKLISTLTTPAGMYYWRAYSGTEVDLILERDGKVYPIEIKSNSHPTKKDARGLKAFRQQHAHLSVQKGLIIAPTDTMYAVSDDDFVIPWDIG